MSFSQSSKRLASLVLIVAGITGAWWYFSSRSAPSVSVAPKPATAVTVFTALAQDVPMTVEMNGSVVSLSSVDVRSQVSNIIEKVHVKEGQLVTRGQLLFTLDGRADRANLDKARAQLARDQATAADLERQYKRSQELVAQNFISQSALDTVQSQLQAQQAALASSRAAVQAAQVALSYNIISSPMAGRTGAINVFAGSLAQPTSSLVTVTQLDPIAVSFPVPESHLQDLLTALRTRAPVTAWWPGSSSAAQGTLSFVDNTVDSQAGTVRAKAVFENAQQQLWPGQFVTVKASTRVLKGATVVPVASVLTTPAGKSVYVVLNDQTVQLREVQLIYVFGEMAAVQGVQAGEKVVLQGKQNLRPGGRVRIDAQGA